MDPTLNGSASRKEESDQAMTHSERVPNDAFVYRHDVIRCSKYKDLLGVVIEVAGDSDSEESASDDSDSEDDQYNNGGLNADTVNGDEENSKFDDDDDGGDDVDLQDGQARVVWVNGSETKEKVGEVTVVDRSFFHGDIVASVSDPTGQLGLVLDVKIMVDLQAPNGEVIKGISSKDLKRVREFSIGDYVVCGPWLGRVDDVFDNLTILFDDGAVCKVTKVDPVRLSPISRPVVDEEDCPYHPGQRVRAVSSSVFKSARWFSGSWKANRLEGTVVKVQTASLMIYWIASAYNGIGTNSSTAPPEEQKPKDLTILHCFSHANWQLCDWCIFPSLSDTDGTSRSSSLKTTVKDSRTRTSDFKDCSIVDNRNGETKCGASSGQDVDSLEVEDEGQPSQRQNRRAVTIGTPHKNVELGDNGSSVSKDTAHESGATYRKKLRKVCFKRDKKARKKDDDIEIAFFIVNTVTSVDVAWQDGTKQYNLDSKSLLPIQSPSDHEFFPEQYVVEKVSSEDDDSSETKRVGIVRSVNAKDRTVCVRWLKPVSRPEDLREFDREEVVSAYELDMHPDYDYCYGDVVVRLPPVMTIGGHGEQSDQEDIDVQASQEHLNDYQTQLSPKEEDCADFKSLSWVGNITGLQDGDIEVTWADGTVSKVGPQAIFVVGRDDEDSFDGGSEVSDAAASWETVDGSDTEILLLAEKIDREGFEDTPDTEGIDTIAIEDSNSGHGGPFSVPCAALGFMTKLATGLFSLGRRQTDVDHMDGSESGSQENSEDLDSTQDGLHSTDDNHVAVTSANGMLHTDDIDNLTSADTRGSEAYSKDDECSFKHFDLAENPVEHYFLNSQTTGDRKWMKKVQQEWTILEKNLPDAIYVRGFEHRFDLLRAVIVGACGTPYQDGLFFFDFYLPPEYPQVPPTAYYHSGGLRINPNLYVDGKVCLSLLNTWTGRGNEVWDPSSSSILQVLVSLQGLVLNSKPYFNEAGYEKQVGTIEGEKNSLPYNENTYLLNLKSMMYLLRRPPTHFEGFVKDHFARRGYYILKACDAYMNGCAIGSLTKDASTTEKSKDQVCSVGFKLMLAKILPRLIVALSEIGVDCKDFEKYNS